MACPITITAPSDGDRRVADAAREALQVFLDVQETCSRFDAGSPLMRANARPDMWHQMPRECFDALRESYEAYVATSGMFDPRVHDTLVANGYDRSLPFSEGMSSPKSWTRSKRASVESGCRGFAVSDAGSISGAGGSI